MSFALCLKRAIGFAEIQYGPEATDNSGSSGICLFLFCCVIGQD